MDYTDLDQHLDELQEVVEDPEPSRGYWSTAWTLVKSIGGSFKSVRYPHRDEREAAWSRYQELVGKLKVRSEEAKRVRQEREERSAAASSDIVNKAGRIRLITPGEYAFSEVILFPLTLVKRILDALLGADPDQLHEIRQQLQHCNEALQKAWAVFKENKAVMLPNDKQRAFDSLQEAREQLDKAWAQWKGANELARQQKHQDWLERQAKRAEGAQRRADFVARVSANIEKLETKLDRARHALDHQLSHLDDLRDKYNSAYSDSFRERCSSWIDETEDRIRSIRESIDKMEDWLYEERQKLS